MTFCVGENRLAAGRCAERHGGKVTIDTEDHKATFRMQLNILDLSCAAKPRAP